MIWPDRVNNWAIGVFAVYLVIAVLVSLLLFAREPQPQWSQVEQTSVREDVEVGNALNAFSAALRGQHDTGEGGRVERRREVQRDLLGPIVPVDCGAAQRLCVKPENCRLFCKDASLVPFDCDQGVCVERQPDANRPADDTDTSTCDTRIGEYGLLVGYNELGVAQWECVQLYPAWQDQSKYCEGGVVQLDARVRTPSYQDCLCPNGTTRIVYKKSLLNQVAYGLPHCVPDSQVKFYSLSYEAR